MWLLLNVGEGLASPGNYAWVGLWGECPFFVYLVRVNTVPADVDAREWVFRGLAPPLRFLQVIRKGWVSEGFLRIFLDGRDIIYSIYGRICIRKVDCNADYAESSEIWLCFVKSA